MLLFRRTGILNSWNGHQASSRAVVHRFTAATLMAKDHLVSSAPSQHATRTKAIILCKSWISSTLSNTRIHISCRPSPAAVVVEDDWMVMMGFICVFHLQKKMSRGLKKHELEVRLPRLGRDSLTLFKIDIVLIWPDPDSAHWCREELRNFNPFQS